MTRLLLLRSATLPFERLAPLAALRTPARLAELFDAEARIGDTAERIGDALYAAAGDAGDEGTDAARVRLALVALRRAVHNRRRPRRKHLNRAAARLDPGMLEELRSFEADLVHIDRLSESVRDAFSADLQDARHALIRLTGEPLYRTGLRLVSRSLHRGVVALAERDPAGWDHDDRHVAAKAAAYLVRFGTKTSPNSVFCAVAQASASAGPMKLAGEPRIERGEVLLSVAEARKVAACLARDPGAEPAVVPRPNPTLREAEGLWTFWKPASPRNPTNDETLSRAKDHPVLRLFLEAARAAAHTPRELLDAVARQVDADDDALTEFYAQLVDSGILIAEVEAPYGERRPLRALASKCRAAGSRAPWLDAVERIESDVDRLSADVSALDLETMERIETGLDALPHVRPITRDELFRVDAASASRIRLPRHVIEELEPAAHAYARLFASMYPRRLYRDAYARRFLERFPADTDVELLDLYHGVFEPGAEETRRPEAFPDPTHDAADDDSAQLAENARRIREFLSQDTRPGEELRIVPSDVDALTGGQPEPRWMAGVLFQLAARDTTEVDAGHYRAVLNGLFPGAGLALARFAHLLGDGSAPSEAVVAELRRGWSPIERPRTVVAELTYTHFGRTANAALRPPILRHEIELPGDLASPGAERIPLTDLLVRYDRAADRFVLTWRSRKIEVLPVITSGVNPVGIISFLVHIGQQEFQPVVYFPGFDMPEIDFWPRVVHGKTVLFRARWVLRGQDWAHDSVGSPLDEAQFFTAVQRARNERGIPRHVFVHSSDDPKPRYTDLESPLLVDLLRRVAAPASSRPPDAVHLTEMLPSPAELWLSGPDGRHACEFLVQLHRS